LNSAPEFVGSSVVSRQYRPSARFAPDPEIATTDDRRFARRFAVYACVIEADAIVSAETSAKPVQELALPMTRDAAREWVLEHFDDLVPDRLSELMSVLTRPTGAL
jgi:hypothetical protein